MDAALDMDVVRDDILVSTLPNIVFDGWSMTALRDGAQMAGYDTATMHRAFPGGIPELVEHFGVWTDRRMMVELDKHPLADMKVRDRIALAIRTHFEVLEPHLEAKRRLIAYLAMPQNLGLGLRLLYRTVDAMWFAAGDTATDFNHYTKRATLGAVLSSATFYWLDDRSEGHVETWAFIDRRLDDVMNMGKAMSAMGRAGRLLSHLPSPMRFARQIRQRSGTVQAAESATTHMAENI
ncbi:COQ9 family protein [Azospirillum canadense]|uniref:COQ9 family protein n=1 Tax=Azospirillum canadense TaxID=403962 RepID=UPI002226934B|nr:COQ9 family protein [Azospirillum canadense]MCW2236312.1 ubiquinone biosynthesis protein COQ9 [Azospirillum canadense]